MSSRCLCGELVPGSGFVIGRVRFKAPVQDPDETVAELAEGHAVADVALAEYVIVGAGYRSSAEGLVVQGVGQTVVARVTSEDVHLLTLGSGDGLVPA